MHDRPTVIVLEAEAKGGLPIIESNHAHGRRVVAGSQRRYNAGFYSRGVRERFLYPSPEFQPEACIEAILAYLARHEAEVLFPVGDVLTYLVARAQDDFRRHTRLVLPPIETFVRGRDKILTLQAAARAGVPIPATWYPHEQPLDAVAREASYPCLIKPAVSAGARGMMRVERPADLLRHFAGIEAEFGRCFVQDFVPQTGMQHKVDAVMDTGGRLVAGVVYDKLRYYPPTGGSSVLNRTVHRPDILDLAVRTMRGLDWYGFCDFDFITDPRDGVVRLMEINPRYPESFRSVYAAGVDMADLIYRMALGEHPEPQLAYRAGRDVRFLFGDLLWFLTSPDRFRRLGSWLDFVGPNVVYQVASARDPGPIIGYALENVSVLLNPAMRRARLRLGQATTRGQA